MISDVSNIKVPKSVKECMEWTAYEERMWRGCDISEQINKILCALLIAASIVVGIVFCAIGEVEVGLVVIPGGVAYAFLEYYIWQCILAAHAMKIKMFQYTRISAMTGLYMVTRGNVEFEEKQDEKENETVEKQIRAVESEMWTCSCGARNAKIASVCRACGKTRS